ncbi:hypothetical protein BN140_3069 [Methanoculleus bourgensis MS2]|uniref:Uncharacterized protein n=1 Tax=Methanoculleus bourgensis (strain ATCC 43281 / DSM 3045 / OCM 15 / MS2) TaxID=1201294 RepID=W6PPR8_METBM|nr:hypothetical protein BN140_3069 [Methanoculleus bourgensis MS2]
MLQWSHVFSDMVRLKPPSIVIPTHSLQWSHVFSDMVRREMRMAAEESFGLQWSHVFSDMVSICHHDDMPPAPCASMEPCLFRHGKPVGRAPAVLRRAASMEPCLFRHGKLPKHWRHVSAGPGLQWSHVFSDMVRRLSVEVIMLPLERFNGAMSFQTW